MGFNLFATFPIALFGVTTVENIKGPRITGTTSNNRHIYRSYGG